MKKPVSELPENEEIQLLKVAGNRSVFTVPDRYFTDLSLKMNALTRERKPLEGFQHDSYRPAMKKRSLRRGKRLSFPALAAAACLSGLLIFTGTHFRLPIRGSEVLYKAPLDRSELMTDELLVEDELVDTKEQESSVISTAPPTMPDMDTSDVYLTQHIDLSTLIDEL